MVVLGIAIASDTASVARYLKQYNIEYPVLIDRTGEIADTYQVRYVPMNYIISKEGVILQGYAGATLSASEILALINKLNTER